VYGWKIDSVGGEIDELVAKWRNRGTDECVNGACVGCIFYLFRPEWLNFEKL
jgi:hypothetical protein